MSNKTTMILTFIVTVVVPFIQEVVLTPLLYLLH